MNNFLKKTRVYCAGPIQFAKKGEDVWRKIVSKKFKKAGITVWSPLTTPFLNFRLEDNDLKQQIRSYMQNKDYENVSNIMKQIVRRDLSMVDKCDFLIAHIDPEVYTCGTFHELFIAIGQRKPVFVFTKDKTKIPTWLFGVMPHHNIFESIEDLTNHILRIDSGAEPINNKYWKLVETKHR